MALYMCIWVCLCQWYSERWILSIYLSIYLAGARVRCNPWINDTKAESIIRSSRPTTSQFSYSSIHRKYKKHIFPAIYIYIYIYIYLLIAICLSIWLFISIYLFIDLLSPKRAHLILCWHRWLVVSKLKDRSKPHDETFTHTHIHTDTRTHTHTRTHIHTRTRTHAHTHTHINWQTHSQTNI